MGDNSAGTGGEAYFDILRQKWVDPSDRIPHVKVPTDKLDSRRYLYPSGPSETVRKMAEDLSKEIELDAHRRYLRKLIDDAVAEGKANKLKKLIKILEEENNEN